MPVGEGFDPLSSEHTEFRNKPLVNPIFDRMSQAERESRVDEFLSRAVEAVYPTADALRARLLSGDRLTAYMGIDPTAPDMHIGHISQLHKLRRLQDMGHEVILLIGDFTARIGDPSDKSATRIQLTHEQVLENATEYKNQASRILGFEGHENPAELRFNSEWLDPLTFADVIKLASEVTVQQIQKRDMFQRRLKHGRPIHLHEFLYPIMQAYDAVAMGVDIEVGGSDQTFNMLVGRDYVKRHLGKEKFVVAGKLVVDPSGKKMGKTEGNMITASESPTEMFGKVMRWGDQIVPHALELITFTPMEEIREIEEQMKTGKLDGLTAKRMLARVLVGELHSPEDASRAESEFDSIVSEDVQNDDIRHASIASGSSLVDFLVDSGLAQSRNAARTLIQQGGVRLNGEPVRDTNFLLNDSQRGAIIQVGKKTRESYRVVDLEE